MPIVARNDESQTTAAATLEAAVGERVTAMAFATSNLRQADASKLAHSTPHRLEILTLDRIRPGIKLRGATKNLGWRFLIHEPAGAIAAATVIKKGDGYEFAGFSEGQLVTGTDQAFHFAEGLEQVRNGHFEARLLEIPELQIAVLWLWDLDGDSDCFIRAPGQVMTSAQFTEYLLDLARITRRKRG